MTGLGKDSKVKLRISLVLLNAHFCQQNITLLIVEVITKVPPFLSPQQFLDKLNHMLNTNIKDVPNFTGISLSSMDKFYLKNTYPVSSLKLCDCLP